MSQLLTPGNHSVASQYYLQSGDSNTFRTLVYEIDDSIDLLRKTTDEVLVEYALLNLEQVKDVLTKIFTEADKIEATQKHLMLKSNQDI